MRLRFIAARHYASRGHWDDAYGYVLRSRPDNIPQHEDVYNRNAQAWHYTNARINELIQEAEQALETRDRELAQGPQFRPPKDSLIPPGHSTGTPSPTRDIGEGEQGLGRSLAVMPTWGTERPEGRSTPKSPLSPDKKSQKEERDSVIDAVKQITGAKKETPTWEGVSVGGTPEYDWHMRYDGISGFPSHLKNRVSEPSTPQRGQSLRGRPQTPPELQRHYRQLKVYDETPTGRPLPTLQQIRQANLCKVFEEEGAETPCDICGDPRHDYRNCTKEAYLESQDVRQDPVAKRVSQGQCPNCDVPHPGICPCAWCDQLGHIAQDCMVHFADSSMQARFPKKERTRRTPIKHYECHCCGESHPFNIYCPTVRDPPVVPGECRSCGTTTKEHANDCQYVAIKDNIGLCTYCRDQDHRYAMCPQWMVDQEAVMREKKKNKKNDKNKGKVKIIASVMTREQDSDSTLSPEGRGQRLETSPPQQPNEWGDIRDPSHSEYVSRTVMSPWEIVCSFCGVAMHSHKDCLVMHQYIREQADALAWKRLEEYHHLQEWVGYESPKWVPSEQDPQ